MKYSLLPRNGLTDIAVETGYSDQQMHENKTKLKLSSLQRAVTLQENTQIQSNQIDLRVAHKFRDASNTDRGLPLQVVNAASH